MLFDDAQSYTTFKSSSRLSQSVTSPTPEYSLVSSAKLTNVYIVLLNVVCFLSLGVCLCSGCDGHCAFRLMRTV